MVQRSKGRAKRGFASMSPEKQREIASKGGKAVPPEKRTFSKNKEMAAEAGRTGGQNGKPENRTFSRDARLAKSAGLKGGAAMRAKGEKPSST